MRETSGGREKAGTSVAEKRVGVGGDERGGRGGRWVASTDHYPGWDWKPRLGPYCYRTLFYKRLCLLGP